jgi:hypothetical protein
MDDPKMIELIHLDSEIGQININICKPFYERFRSLL